ncbi:MAG: ATP-binding protein [Bryobacteraceae bacterium]
MNRLRNRLVLVFLASTLIPLAATLWITARLLDRSLSYATTSELDSLSRSLETTAREYYRQARDRLREDAAEGRVQPVGYLGQERARWPAAVREFWESGEAERFFLAGEHGERLNYAVRDAGDGVRVFTLDLGPVAMGRIGDQFRKARSTVASLDARDLRRGFTYTLVILSAGLWLAATAVLVLSAIRISRPIHQLTKGLQQLSAGNLDIRLAEGANDEVGRAIRAFNHTAAELRESRDRLIYLAQMASWQSLARKMAHEVKNSLTPIRLNMEEIVARHGENDASYLEQAAQIVADEVNSLERRVRAFSEFAAEPPVLPTSVDINALIAERIEFLRRGRPMAEYQTRLVAGGARALVDEDVARGIFTNLLENAAEAAPSPVVLVTTTAGEGEVIVEVHDSGPGLSTLARQTLFEPTISFKKGGMGLGLSIARKSALLSGGDITLAKGELGGAAFRVRLPAAGRAGEERISA